MGFFRREKAVGSWVSFLWRSVAKEGESSLNGWVRAAVEVIASAASRAEPVLWRGKEALEEHPVLEFLYEANPYNLRQFIYLAVWHLELYGQSGWLLVRRAGRVVGLTPFPRPSLLRPRVKGGFVVGYEYGDRVYPAEEVLRIWRPRPDEPTEPWPTVEAVEDAAKVDAEAVRWLRGALENGYLIPFVVVTKGPPPSPEDRDLIVEQLRSLHRGPEAAGEPAFIPGDVLEIRPLETFDLGALTGALPFRELRDRILGIFGVPASKLGLVEDVNRANAEANDLTFRREVVHPRLVLIADALNTQLVPQLTRDDVWLEFPVPEAEEPELELRRTQVMLREGVLTPNEVRRGIGLEPASWGDVPLELAKLMLSVGLWEPKAKVNRALNRRDYLRLRRKLDGEALREHRKVVADLLAEVSPAAEGGAAAVKARAAKVVEEWRRSEKHVPRLARAYRAAYEAGRAFGAGQTGRNLSLSKEEPLFVWEGARLVYTLMLERLLQSLLDALGTELASPQELAALLGEWASEAENTVALRAARLAVTRNFTQGQLEAYREGGVRRKVWLTTGDDRVRESHAAMEGVSVPVEEDFVLPSGARGPAPGHISDMSENWNCRCVLAPEV